jgi:hypothetical protein
MMLLKVQFLRLSLISTLLNSNIVLNNQILNIQKLCSSHNVNDQVWYSYKSKGKVIEFYILIVVFFKK